MLIKTTQLKSNANLNDSVKVHYILSNADKNQNAYEF